MVVRASSYCELEPLDFSDQRIDFLLPLLVFFDHCLDFGRINDFAFHFCFRTSMRISLKAATETQNEYEHEHEGISNGH